MKQKSNSIKSTSILGANIWNSIPIEITSSSANKVQFDSIFLKKINKHFKLAINNALHNDQHLTLP